MSIITGTVTKEQVDSKVGISFSNITEESPLMVSVVKEGGLFSSTDIIPGLLVLTVNGVDVTDKSHKEAAGLLREAEAGDVTVVAKGVVAKATKATPDGLCGLVIKKFGESPILTVSKINEDGIFGSSELTAGLVIAAINGVKCPPHPKEAAKLLKEAKEDVTVVAWDPVWAVVEPEPEDAPMEEEEKSTKEEEEYVEVEAPKEVLERKVEDDEEPPHSILDNLCTICSA